jgi:hypothetical protein
VATGQSEGGGVMAPPDVRGAGDLEWSVMSGAAPGHPLVGGGRQDYGGIDPEFSRGDRIVTTPEGQMGSGTGDMADAPGVELLDDWRDLFNWKGSPMPWLLLFALLFLGFMQFRVDARASAGRARASASAALG